MRALLWSLLLLGCGDSTSGLSPDATCDRYLACVKTTSPSGFGAALNAYGNNSSCWHSTTQAADSCREACATATRQLGASCGCTRDDDCAATSPFASGTSRCDVSRRECVQCLSDGDCAKDPLDRHLCDTDHDVCIACKSNDDCADKVCSTSAQGTPFCGGCSNVTDGCVSPCDVFFNCTLGKASASGDAWKVCLGSDSCCDQASCGRYQALRSCLLQNCGDVKPDPQAFDSLTPLVLCAETKCADVETACHQNGC